MQSANVGQIAHPYGTWVTFELTGSELAYSFQLIPACVSRSMMVGTWRTGECFRTVPDPSVNGTQAGWLENTPVAGFLHFAYRPLSHPHPGPLEWPGRANGLLPTKPSRVAAASSRCAPHDGTEDIEKVRSEMTKRRASRRSVGVSWAGWYCE